MCSTYHRNRVRLYNHVITIVILNKNTFVFVSSIRHSYFRTLFYMYSFLFLIFRTTAVVMQASAINDESKKIVPEIFMCPTHSYSIEVIISLLLYLSLKKNSEGQYRYNLKLSRYLLSSQSMPS